MDSRTAAISDLRTALWAHHGQLVSAAGGQPGLRGEPLLRRLAEVNEVLEDVRPKGRILSLAAPEPAWKATEQFYQAWDNFLRYDELIDLYQKDKSTPGVRESMDEAHQTWDAAHEAIKVVLRELDELLVAGANVASPVQHGGVHLTVNGNANVSTGIGNVTQTLSMSWQDQARALLADVAEEVSGLEDADARAAVSRAADELRAQVDGGGTQAEVQSALSGLAAAAGASGMAVMTAAGSEVGTTIGQQIAQILKAFVGMS